LLYYIMPFVEGESLRERLRRYGPLPLSEVVRIAGEVAEGLDFAHARSIVHRDVKPENILLVDDHSVVADFGIAKALSCAAGEQTSGGLAIGTPAYMSPEQIIARAAIDGRADIYSLGCVVYEMLAGQPPFHGETLQAVVAGHLSERPPRLRTIAPSLPESTERAVEGALEKGA
jgi:eukaryotic-like serine/threonine-protein kinase